MRELALFPIGTAPTLTPFPAELGFELGVIGGLLLDLSHCGIYHRAIDIVQAWWGLQVEGDHSRIPHILSRHQIPVLVNALIVALIRAQCLNRFPDLSLAVVLKRDCLVPRPRFPLVLIPSIPAIPVIPAIAEFRWIGPLPGWVSAFSIGHN